MHTKALYRAGEALWQVGMTVLRFNFRGVGTSTGSHDEGIGEKDDLKAAMDWLADCCPDLPMIVGGFSFGSMVGMSVGVEDHRAVGLVGMGVPIEVYDYSFLGGSGKPTLVVQGDEDHFGSGAMVQGTLESLGEHITVVRIPGAGHLFEDHVPQLQAAVREFFSSGPGATLLRSDQW
jgi:alpha/beta superfamily hydrolase